jgi:serine protease AprX
MRRLLPPLSLALALLLAVFAGADAPLKAEQGRTLARRGARLDSVLRAVLNDSTPPPQRVIIRVKAGARGALRSDVAAHGGRIVAEHDSLNALTAVVRGEDLARLADSDAILSISRDVVVRPHSLLGGLGGLVGSLVGTLENVVGVVANILLPNGADTSGPPVPPDVLRSTLGVNGSPWAGRGVGVAVIDSGLEMSSEFYGRVEAFYDFTSGGIVARTPYDDYGHGTHIAGIIGGSGSRSSEREYRGLAPRVNLLVLKVLDGNGAGYTSDVIRAIDFAVANRDRFGIDIVNLSLGHPIYEPAATDPLVQAVERATRAGIIVIAASGNYGKNPETGLPGYAGVTSPGNAPSAITVGAVRTSDTVTRTDDRIADYSSAGPTWYDSYLKPDLVAPGHNIIALGSQQGTLYKTYPELKAADADYMRLSGTSMATAVTTGSVALLLEANREANPGHPALTPNAVKAILQYTSVGIRDDAGIEYNPLRKGAGSLNPKGAIDLARRIDTSTPAGQWWLTTTPYPWTSIGNESLAWSQAVIWGNAIIWGSTTYVNEAAWGSAIIWGSNTAWSSAIIWGSNLVWTDPQAWSTAIIWGSDNIGQRSVHDSADGGDAIIWGSSGTTPDDTVWKDLEGDTSSAGQ